VRRWSGAPCPAIMPQASDKPAVRPGSYANLDPTAWPGLDTDTHAESEFRRFGAANSAFRTATHVIPGPGNLGASADHRRNVPYRHSGPGPSCGCDLRAISTRSPRDLHTVDTRYSRSQMWSSKWCAHFPIGIRPGCQDSWCQFHEGQQQSRRVGLI
jgi:hypothetical protein